MNTKVCVSAPSRLHFGLLRFAQQDGPSFGGLGMMIAQPRTVVEIATANHWTSSGPNHERATLFAQQALAHWAPETFDALRVDVKKAPPAHSGLGSGTQLSLAVISAVAKLCNQNTVDLEELVAVAGRGNKSAVGCYGFQRGGLIFEDGYQPGDLFGRMIRRAAIPEDWHILLIQHRAEQGISGQTERDAFSSLPPVPQGVTDELLRLAVYEIFPAAVQNNFDSFGEAVYQYGLLAGECFSAIQGSPFASSRISAFVRVLRDMGIAGVGQSSWGPTVFAFTESHAAAMRLQEQLQSLREFADTTISIAAPCNQGAQITSQASHASVI